MMPNITITLDDKTYAQICMRALDEEKCPELIVAECIVAGMIGAYSDVAWDEMEEDEMCSFIESETAKRLANA